MRGSCGGHCLGRAVNIARVVHGAWVVWWTARGSCTMRGSCSGQCVGRLVDGAWIVHNAWVVW